MADQRPLQFEFHANKSFADYYPGANHETVMHLRDSVTGNGEPLIFIWGSKGLGKSHLLQACCQLARQKDKSSFYLQLSKPVLPDPSILESLHEYKIICVDNVENIAGNAGWEQAFFHFFNLIREHGNHLLLAASTPPAEIAVHLPDLQTRLNWGLTLKLKSLNEADRIAALSFKARQAGFDISPQVGRFLLAHYSRDLPSLWALLNKIDHETLAAKRKLTIPFLKQILENHYEN